MNRLSTFVFLTIAFVGGGLHAQEPGVLDNFQSGLPIAIWSDDQTARAVEAIDNAHISNQPAINRLRNSILLAKSSPDLTDENSDALARARIDYLYRAGALDQAEALAELYPIETDDIQPLRENLALLTTRSENYCNALRDGQIEEIEDGMEIYCLLRDDQYNLALRIFDNRPHDEARQALLSRYLDLDNDKDPARNERWTVLPEPLPFVMDEALGRPRGNDRLPRPYLYFSRHNGNTPRADLEATEALVQAAALPPNILIYAYRQRRSAESGGAWGRAEIIQALDGMNPEQPNKTLDKYLPLAMYRFDEAQLLPVFAQEASQWLSGIPLAAIDNDETRDLIIKLGFLGGWSQPSWRNYIHENDTAALIAHGIRHPFGEVVKPNDSATPLEQAAFDAFFDGATPSIIPPTGLRLWRALEILDDYENMPSDQNIAALQTLIGLGQRETAADLAIEALLGQDA